jgi:hypothetical protein
MIFDKRKKKKQGPNGSGSGMDLSEGGLDRERPNVSDALSEIDKVLRATDKKNETTERKKGGCGC